MREYLESHQVAIYFAAIVLAILLSVALPDTSSLEAAINPALALMLFVTFLQVPIADLSRAVLRVRFLVALLAANFIVIPLLVFGLLQLLPAKPMVRLGVLFVLLTPCIDYVVTFSHIGRADAKLLLASTPALLIVQMLLLPVYLILFLGDAAAGLVEVGPFIHAFVWLIAIPLVLAAVLQLGASGNEAMERAVQHLGILPVPSTVLVLFLVFMSVVPQLSLALDSALSAAPVYVAFAIAAPLLGWGMALIFRLDAPAGRAVAFSAATRNSLVVLPLALAVPGAMPVIPAVIVTQTVVELISSLIYIRAIPHIGANKSEEG